MDDVTMTFEQLVDCAKAHRSKVGGWGSLAQQGLGAFGRSMATGAKNLGQGMKSVGGMMARNPGKTTAGITGAVGLGAMGPGGLGARALGSMGVIDDPVKQYGSNRVTADRMRNQFYDNEYAPAQQKYQLALAGGTATPEDYQKIQEMANKYRTGNYGGGLFSSNQSVYQQRALDAGNRMRQPYKPSVLNRLFGGYADQEGYNQYAKDQLSQYDVPAPPGFGTPRAGVGPLLPNAPLLHRNTGQMYTQAPTPLDPTQMALQNLYSGREQLPSAWH